ncbi:MAG: GIY-YIG nuclease family protein [Clostridia bacterium]|nr:GIY-YIG nuclease family protein [Clostridia bacterium]
MTAQEIKKRMAIIRANKERILKVCRDVPERSGIYFLTREEGGFKYAYVGQAKRLLTRLAEHLTGYQHIDLSLKKHGLWSEDNPTGWKVAYIECQEQHLDEQEQSHIKAYANMGYQLRNKTSGSQGKGKKDIADEPTKGYLEGLHNGYKKAQKEIAHLFKLHLKCETKKDPPTKLQAKALDKFNNFISIGD